MVFNVFYVRDPPMRAIPTSMQFFPNPQKITELLEQWNFTALSMTYRHPFWNITNAKMEHYTISMT